MSTNKIPNRYRRSYTACLELLRQAEFNMLIVKQNQEALLRSANLFATFDREYYELLAMLSVLNKLPVVDDLASESQVK